MNQSSSLPTPLLCLVAAVADQYRFLSFPAAEVCQRPPRAGGSGLPSQRSGQSGGPGIGCLIPENVLDNWVFVKLSQLRLGDAWVEKSRVPQQLWKLLWSLNGFSRGFGKRADTHAALNRVSWSLLTRLENFG